MAEYVQFLRSIGQALDLLRVEDFELEIEGGTFLVKCCVPRPQEMIAGQAEQSGLLQHVWGALPVETRLELNMTVTGQFKADDIDLHYTLKDAGRLNEEGKARRGTANEGGAPGLSQFLRAVGAYVTQKPARLQKISRRDDAMTIRYETVAGESKEEVLSLADVYELGVWMPMKRADRKPS
jgi:hypothetical protein